MLRRRCRTELRKTMLRPRRLCFLTVVCILVLYFPVAIWLFDSDLQHVLYKISGWYYNGYLNSSEAREIACYYENTHNTLQELEDNIRADSGIFFLETSCHSEPGIHLSPRQACAVESAAKMNPRKDVYVLFPGPVVDNVTSLSASVRQLLLYPNVRLRHVNMQRYFAHTPLYDWYESGILRSSYWPRSHASDVLRYATLWKYGGIYLDLDVVVTKSLTELSNFAGAESDEDVAAGVLSFSHEGIGSEMANLCVRDLRHGFRGYDWGNNGPGVITRVLKSICGTDKVSEMTLERCRGFTVFPPHAFYPIPWTKWRLYFNSTHSEETLRHLATSHTIHVWNKFSTNENVTVGSRQPYSVIASQFCPRVYSHVGKVF